MATKSKFSGGVRKHATPLLRRKPKRKLKRLPRGRSFEKGNSYGIATRFQPGNRANPGGRPASAKLSEAYRALLALPVGEAVEIRTNAEAMAYKVFSMGTRGNMGACREVGDRSEGRPAVSIQVNEGKDPLDLLLDEMREMHAREFGSPDRSLPGPGEAEEDAQQ